MCDADDVVAPGWVRAMGDALRDARVRDRTARHHDAESRTGCSSTRGPGDRRRARAVLRRASSSPTAATSAFRTELVDRGRRVRRAPRGGRGHRALGPLRPRRRGARRTSPDAVVRYRYRDTVRGLWRQARSYGQVRPELFRRVAAAGDRRARARGRPAVVGVPGAPPRAARLRAGRAKWVWVAGGNVGRLEGDLHVPWAGRVR